MTISIDIKCGCKCGCKELVHCEFDDEREDPPQTATCSKCRPNKAEGTKPAIRTYDPEGDFLPEQRPSEDWDQGQSRY